MPRVRSSIYLAAVICTVAMALPALASAAITVNTTADQAPSATSCRGVPGDCSLRQAISWASELADGTVILPAGYYTLTLRGPEEEANQSGDLDTGSKIQINGAGARTTVIDATGLGERVFDVHENGSLGLSRLTVTGGEAIDVDGGGIRVYGGSLNLDQVAVKNNVSSGEGYGGGFFAENAIVTVNASLLAGNRNSGDGGGFFAEEGETTVVNSTIADNVVDTSLYPGQENWGAYGGGVEVSAGKLTMQNVTVAGNSIRDGNGGGDGTGTGLAVYPEEGEFVNTIVYGNSGAEVEFFAQCAPVKPDERLISGGHNLEQQPPAGEQRCFETPSDLIADPRLGPLADNGGETDTMALLDGSPAFNAADAAKCPTTDQRGLPRPSLGGCDIGAFEVQPVPPPPPPAIAAPAITRKGKVVVKKAGKTFLVKPGFSVTCPVTDPTCTGTIKVRAPKLKVKSAGTSAAKKVLIGKATFSVAPGKTKKLSLKLNAKGAKMLRLAGKLRGQFEVSSHAGTGPAATSKATLQLKLPPSRKKH
ncbi:MAG TPA: right-handed parallel beta-helix repeat-containing protein [Solirubrobacterales bacterium]|nr:right-handed parallel beta-helix repeat-containing protein [Solirubrobacterales bacterium]